MTEVRFAIGATEEGLCVKGSPYQKNANDEDGILGEEQDDDKEDVKAILQSLDSPMMRIPPINVGCDCERTPPVKKQQVSCASDSDSEVEGFGLGQLLRTLLLYEKQPAARRHKGTILRLASGVTSTDPITADEINELIRLCQHEEAGLQEAATRALHEVCRGSPHNARLMCTQLCQLLDIMASPVSSQVHVAVSKSLAALFQQDIDIELWSDVMATRGLSLIVEHLTDRYKMEVRYACGQLLRTLTRHTHLLQPILSSAVEHINGFKAMTPYFQMLYSEIFAQILRHQSELPLVPNLMNDVLLSAKLMLEQGPCGPQRQAVQLLSSLCSTEDGIQRLMSDQLLRYVLSAFADTDCRLVKESAIECLAQLLSSSKSHTQKELLLAIDHFFFAHKHPDQPDLDLLSQISPGKYVMEITLRIQRAVERLTQEFISVLHNNAKVELDNSNSIVKVNLSSSLDVYQTRLNTISHVTKCLGHMIRLSMLRVKVRVDNMRDSEIRELKNIRKKLHAQNYFLANLLLDNGAAALVDILYVYTKKLAPSHSTAAPKIAWATDASANNTRMHIESVFSENEICLLYTLLQTLHTFAQCSCETVLNLEEVTKAFYKEYNKSMEKRKKQASEEVECGRKNRGGSSELFCQGDFVNDSGSDDDFESDLMLRYREAFTEAVGPLQKHIRRCLFEAGLLDALVPLLQWEIHQHMQSYLSSIIIYMIQPLQEPEYTRTSQPVAPAQKTRPASAATTRHDRDSLLDKALIRMSPTVRSFIDETLAEPISMSKGPPSTPTSFTNTHYNKFARSGRSRRAGRPCSAKSSISEAKKSRVTPSHPASCLEKPSDKHKSFVPAKEKIKTWRPDMKYLEPIAFQCRLHLIQSSIAAVLHKLFSKDEMSRRSTLSIIHQLLKHAEFPVLMKLSQAGLVTKLVDFLRVNDDNDQLLLMALHLVEIAVQKDVRMNQLLSYHGGIPLLISMTSSCNGIVKEHVARTLRTATKSSILPDGPPGRAIQSAPACRTANQMLDIWDKLQERWEDEDRVTLMMRRYAMF